MASFTIPLLVPFAPRGPPSRYLVDVKVDVVITIFGRHDTCFPFGAISCAGKKARSMRRVAAIAIIVGGVERLWFPYREVLQQL